MLEKCGHIDLKVLHLKVVGAIWMQIANNSHNLQVIFDEIDAQYWFIKLNQNVTIYQYVLYKKLFL